MDKPTITTVTGQAQNNAFQVNTATDELADAIADGLGRDGTDSMAGNLDMNSNKITNLGSPTADTDAARLLDISDSDATGAASATLKADLGGTGTGKGSELIGDFDDAVEDVIEAHEYVNPLKATGGIAFSDTPVAANTLDYYIEGTFTPVIADAPSGGNTGTASVVSGLYTRIGNRAFIDITLLSIDTTGMTGTNKLYIRDLPYTPAARASGAAKTDNIAGSHGITSNVITSETYVEVGYFRTGATFYSTDVNQLTSGTANIIISISYQIA